jgi:hypothetical protein
VSASAGFATFWHGPLNAFAFACLASFVRQGAPIAVYSYDATLEPPAGVERLDARAICPDPTILERYRVGGKASIATFADMFRYQMIRDTERCWVDCDLFCLKRPDFAAEPYVFARQADAVSEELVNNAVLRLPKDDPALAELIATANAALDVDVAWGALGPFLLTPLLQRHGSYARARAPGQFYPVEPEQFWKLFLPDRREEIAAKVADATFVHLWSEAIRWSGWEPAIGPPPGSFLNEAFASVGALGRFVRIAAAGEAEAALARFAQGR